MKRKKSSRKYPEKDCFNPAPHEGSKFIPYDSRQIFCCTQCRIDYYNDLRKKENETRYAEESVLRRIDKQLQLLYKRYYNGKWCNIHIGFLAHVQIDVLNYCITVTRDKTTGKQISWFYLYGVSIDPKDANFIIIHKKNAL